MFGNYTWIYKLKYECERLIDNRNWIKPKSNRIYNFYRDDQVLRIRWIKHFWFADYQQLGFVIFLNKFTYNFIYNPNFPVLML